MSFDLHRKQIIRSQLSAIPIAHTQIVINFYLHNNLLCDLVLDLSVQFSNISEWFSIIDKVRICGNLIFIKQ